MPLARSKRGNSRRRPNTRKVVSKTLSRQLHGSSMRTRADPPSIVDRPWNTVTLTLPLTAAGNITVALVNAAFNNQVGSGSTTPGMLYRFKEARAWELSGTDLSMGLYDFLGTSGAGEYIRSQQDQPGRNHWARVASMWSVTQQNNVISSTDTTLNVLFLASTATTPNIRLHLNLLWRFQGPPSPQIREAQLSLPGTLTEEQCRLYENSCEPDYDDSERALGSLTSSLEEMDVD